MKRIFQLVIGCALSVVFVFSGCAKTPDKKPDEQDKVITPQTYGSYWMRQHDDETMPVGAYNSCPPKVAEGDYNYLENESTFIAYAEAGVNTMMGLMENTASKSVYQALDWCSMYGLAYLVRYAGGNNTSLSMAKATLSRARYYDAFAGVMQTDEPGRIEFENIQKSAEIITSVLPEEIQESSLMHVNLFPTYATPLQLYNRTNSGTLPEGGYTYAQYIEDYFEIVKPKVLSYDNYPLVGGEGVLRGRIYFENMSYIRKAALQHNVPFWVFIQTCSFSPSTRIPNEAELLWQVNTALSFGAKGIQYFTGVLPHSGAEKFNGAMFDLKGNKTLVYDYVKTANMQIGAVDEVLMHAHSKGVMTVGSLPYDGNSGFAEDDLLSSYGALKSASGNHSLIGCFDHDGKDAFYITNNSILESETLTLNFNGKQKGYFVQNAQKQEFEKKNLALELKAGEGILIVL